MDVEAAQIAFLILFVTMGIAVAQVRGSDAEPAAPLAEGEKARLRRAEAALWLNGAGVVLSVVGLFLAWPWLVGVVAVLFLCAFPVTISVFGGKGAKKGLRDPFRSVKLRLRLPRWLMLPLVALIVLGVLVVTFLVALPTSSSSIGERIKGGPYRVYGTCDDLSCTLNICEKAKACGRDNIGRLREGRSISIECQVRGGRVETADGSAHSSIWDRLVPRAYISDLFVKGTAVNRFSKGLSRCGDL